jgi:hypothetical protein
MRICPFIQGHLNSHHKMVISIKFDLFDYCFPYCSRIFHLYIESLLSMKGSKMWAYRQRSGPFSIPAVTCGLGLSGFIQRSIPFNRLLWLAKRCGGLTRTWILTDPIQSPLMKRKWVLRTYFYRGCHGSVWLKLACWFWRKIILRCFFLTVAPCDPWGPWS